MQWLQKPVGIAHLVKSRRRQQIMIQAKQTYKEQLGVISNGDLASCSQISATTEEQGYTLTLFN